MFEERDWFYTISKKSEGEYKERGSRFISFAFPVNDENEIKEKLDLLRKDYKDARHQCYAYRLGINGESFRANDDGEPSNSAGNPILGQIKSAGLTNTLVVVVRYFGGTKLGVGGLVNAYRTAANESIQANSIVKKYVTEQIEISFDYDDTNTIQRIINQFDLSIEEQKFDMKCSMRLSGRKNNAEEFKKALSNFISF
ncbi:MAG: YigZ family protein [Bacteroidota bacterium]